MGHTLAASSEQHWPVELNHASATQLLALRVKSRTSASLNGECCAGGMLPPRDPPGLEEKAELELSQLIEAQRAGLVSVVIEAHLARSPSCAMAWWP